ncbi:hypothetical protein IWW50_005684, partial [Coemansia erecta]
VDDADGISIRRLLSGILARPALAEQMLDDVAQLVWATRSARAVDMWKRICADSRKEAGQAQASSYA